MPGSDRTLKPGASPQKGCPVAVFAVAAAATLLLDQVTKALALALLHPSVPLGRAWLRLTLTRNVGSAFGLVPGGRVLVVAGLTLSLATLAYVLVGKGLKRHPGRALSLALVFGGAVGNLADRARTGAVTDFIDLTVWPVFNVADIAITLGAALLAINLLRGH